MEAKVKQKRNSSQTGDIHPQRIYNITRGRECNYGINCKNKSCTYNHPIQPIQPRYDNSYRDNRTTPERYGQQTTYKRERSRSPLANRCKYILQRQTCPFGNRCKYEHTIQPRQPRYDNSYKDNGYKKGNINNSQQTNHNSQPNQWPGTETQNTQMMSRIPTTQTTQTRQGECTICIQNGDKGWAHTHREEAHCSFCKIPIHPVETCRLAWKHNNKCTTCGKGGHDQDSCTERAGLN